MFRLLIVPVVAAIPCIALAADARPPLAGPSQPADTSKVVRKLQGIDCTFGVACPIIWSPKK